MFSRLLNIKTWVFDKLISRHHSLQYSCSLLSFFCKPDLVLEKIIISSAYIRQSIMRPFRLTASGQCLKIYIKHKRWWLSIKSGGGRY